MLSPKLDERTAKKVKSALLIAGMTVKKVRAGNGGVEIIYTQDHRAGPASVLSPHFIIG